VLSSRMLQFHKFTLARNERFGVANQNKDSVDLCSVNLSVFAYVVSHAVAGNNRAPIVRVNLSR
jgi:hypothetical protein